MRARYVIPEAWRAELGSTREEGHTPVNATLRRMLDTGEAETAEGQRLPIRDHISAEEGAFLQTLILDTRPLVSIEIGLAFGVSALFMCEALREAGGERHIAVDPLQDELWEGAGCHALEQAGFADLVEFIPEPSEIALPRLLAEGRAVDFAFIDGAHHFDHALLDFFYVDRLLRPGGVLVIDDAFLPSVHRVCRFVLTNRAYTVRASLSAEDELSRRRRIGELAGRIPGARRALKPTLIRPDRFLGLVSSSRAVALVKQADDTRLWDHYLDF